MLKCHYTDADVKMLTCQNVNVNMLTCQYVDVNMLTFAKQQNEQCDEFFGQG